MTPTPQGTATIRHNASSTTATADMPASIVTGELLVAQVLSMADWRTGVTSNHGYTQLGAGEGIAGINFSVWYKVATVSETAATWTGPAADVNSVALFRVNAHGNAWDNEVSPITSGAGTAGTLVVPQITTDVNDELLLVFQGANINGTFANITGMTEFYEGGSATGNTRSVAMAYETRATAGATGSRTIDPSANARIIGVMAAIKPVGTLIETVGMIPI